MRSYIDKYGRRKGTPPPTIFDVIENAVKGIDFSKIAQIGEVLSENLSKIRTSDFGGVDLSGLEEFSKSYKDPPL